MPLSERSIDVVDTLLEATRHLANCPASSTVARCLTPEYDGKRYVVGLNDTGRKLAELVEIEGFIDDDGLLLNSGYKTLKLSEVPSGSFVINCALAVNSWNVQKKLLNRPGLNIVSYGDLANFDRGFPAPNFSEGIKEHLTSNRDAYNKLFDSLIDDESRRAFTDTISYRLTQNPSTFKDYEVRIKRQYLEDFLNRDLKVIVDGGGYDGDTAKAFAQYFFGFEKIFIFEPSDIHCEKARISFKSDPRFIVRQTALSDKPEELLFETSSGTNGTIRAKNDDSAYASVVAERLDCVIGESVDFIKLDVEGWEEHALRGASRIIAINRPCLAVACYHSVQQMLSVYQTVSAIRPDYDVRLRHYTQGWTETVLFFS
jgi:FkbM family methyltransferase